MIEEIGIGIGLLGVMIIVVFPIVCCIFMRKFARSERVTHTLLFKNLSIINLVLCVMLTLLGLNFLLVMVGSLGIVSPSLIVNFISLDLITNSKPYYFVMYLVCEFICFYPVMNMEILKKLVPSISNRK